ncbi:MAG: hypothetical protein VXA34_00215 [Gammaproteobacteria bacterium]
MSTLYVDTINEKTSGNGIYIPNHVLQVVHGTVGTTTSGVTATGTNSFADSGLQANITPSSTSSKILINYQIFLGSTASAYQTKSRIVRDSTPVGLGTQEGTRGVASAVSKSYSNYSNNGQYHTFPQGISFLDEPSTTSQITYKIQVAAYNGQTWYLNRAATYQDAGTSGYDAIPLSVVTLMEIGG